MLTKCSPFTIAVIIVHVNEVICGLITDGHLTQTSGLIV